MKWMEMSWPDMQKVDREKTVVIAPFGSIEQHSHHLPVCTDTLLIGEIADRLNQRFADALLILPVQWLGLSRHHLEFGATLTAELDTHAEMVYDIASSVLDDGFVNLFLLNGHGGNAPTLEVAGQELSIEHPDATIVWASYWNVAAEQIETIRETPHGGIGHAGEMETSMVMAVRPELVHDDQMEPDGRPPASEFVWKDITKGGSVSTYETFAQLTHHGGFGDPTLASAEKGEKFFAAIVDRLALVIEDLQEGRFTRE